MSYSLIAKETHKARKGHRCTYCFQAIETGATYHRERCIFDGEPQVNKWHPECWDAFAEIVRYEGGYAEFTPGEGERPAVTETGDT